MLKIKDENGKTIMVLKDDASAPEPVEEVQLQPEVEEEQISVEETEEGEEENADLE